MKQYNKILSFGCSFTEGGGLNSPAYHNYLQGITRKGDNDVKPEYIEYMNANAYPAQLAKILDCEFENYGTSRSSNGLIFKKLYERTSDIQDGTNTLVTIQTTLLSRIMLYLDKEDEFITMNNFDGLPNSVAKYYETYLREFFNRSVEFKKLIQNIDVYTAYLRSKNFDVVWMMYETVDSVSESSTMLSFDGRNLSEFIGENKLRLADLPDFPVNDTHFSVEGNGVVAERIVKHLEKYYG